MSLSRSELRGPVRFIQLKHGLLHVSLGHHTMPLVVIEGRVRMHHQLHRSVSNVEGEGDDFRSCTEREKRRNIISLSHLLNHMKPHSLKPNTSCSVALHSAGKYALLEISNLMAHLFQGPSFGWYRFQICNRRRPTASDRINLTAVNGSQKLLRLHDIELCTRSFHVLSFVCPERKQ